MTTLRKANGRVRIEDHPPRAARSDHLHLDPVDRISESELRLSCAADGVSPGAQHDLARTDGTPEENEPLPGSLGPWFHLRLRPRRAAVDADIDPMDSTVCPCPSPKLLRCIALERLPGSRRHDDGFRSDRPDRNPLSGVLATSVENRVVIPASRERPRCPAFHKSHSRKPFDAVSSIKTRDNEADRETVFCRQSAAIHFIGDQNIRLNASNRKILEIGIDDNAAEFTKIRAVRPNVLNNRARPAIGQDVGEPDATPPDVANASRRLERREGTPAALMSTCHLGRWIAR